MISIECSNIKELQIELAAYLSEKLPAVPVVRTNDIVLDPLIESQVNVEDARVYVKTFLARHSIDNDFLVNVNGDKIQIMSVSERKLQKQSSKSDLLTCPHCGMVTPYKEELDVHVKIHYIFSGY